MSTFFRVIGTVASIVAVIPSPIQPIAAAVAVGANIGAAVTAKRPANDQQGRQLQFKIGADMPIPFVMGRTAVGGSVVYRDTYGKDNSYQTFFIVLSASSALTGIGGIESFTADKATVPFAGMEATGYFARWMWQDRQLGVAPAPAALTNGIVRPPYGFAGTPPGWGADAKLSGYAATSLSLLYDSKARRYAQGEPTPSWIVKGNLVYDPRRDSTYPGGSGPCRWADPSNTAAFDAARRTWIYSDTPALHGLMWRLGVWWRDMADAASRYQKIMGIGAPIDMIDLAAIVQAANVQEANGWRIGGEITSAQDKWEVLKLIEQTGGCEPIAVGAMMSTLVKAPRVSLRRITAADLADGMLSAPGVRRRSERLNGFRARFRSEPHGWEIVPIDIVQVPAYVAEDGRARTGSGDFSLCPDPDQCAELAAYEVFDSRELEPITLPLKPFAVAYRLGDCLTVDIEEIGLQNRDVIVRGRRVDPATGIVTLTLRTETAAKHPAALGLTGETPPTPTLTADPDSIATPAAGSWTLTAGTAVSNGLTVPAIYVDGAVDNGNADGIVIEYRRVGDGTWSSTGLLPPDTRQRAITPVEAGVSYEAVVRYRGRGIYSDGLLIGPIRTPDASADWETGVTGPKKPDDNATNSADPNTPFGPGGTVGEAIAALERIEPIETDISALEKAKVEHDDALALLDSVQVDMAAIQRQAERDAGKLDEAMLRLLSESARTREVLRDAGIVVDPATGVVRIYAIDQVAERTSRVEVGLDAVRGTVALKASSEWVSEQIALAVLNPEQAAQLEPIIKRLANAELIVDGLTGAITSKAEAVDVTDLGGRVTTVSESLDTLTGAIKEKVDRTTFDSLGETVQSIEQTLSTLGDTTGMSLTIRQARLVADDAATAALRGAIAGDEANRRQIVQAAEARQDIYTRIRDGELTEARARLALAVEVGDVRAMTVSETAARIDAVGAVASAVEALGVTSGEQAVAIGEISKAALTAQGGVASTQMTIRQVVGRADTSDEALLRALIAGDEASRARRDQVVQIQTEFATTLVANEQASAVARQSLLARMGAAEAAIVENSRVLADTARSIVERLAAAEAVVNDKVTGLAATRARLVDEEKLSAERSAAIAESVQTLDATITDAKTGLPAAHAGIAQVAKAVVDGDKATAELVEQVTAKLGDLGTATVQDLIKAVVEETGRIMATRTIAIDINGNVVGTQLVGAEEGRGSLNLINADFRLGTGRIILNTGTSMLAIGVGFGAQNDLLLWYGPTMALTECSRSNARMHLPTVGQAYFGGGLSAGSKSTPGETMSLSADTAATVSWFGSDGRPVQYVCAWSYRSTSERVYPPTAEGRDAYDRDVAAYNATGDGFQAFGQKTVEQPRSTVTLSRTFDGNTYTQLEQVGFTTQRLTFRGIAPNVGDGPGRGTFTTDIGGGFTTRDPVQSTANRALRLALSRGFNLGVDGVVQRLSVIAIEE